MSFFDETKNAGLLLVIIALLGIVFTAVAAFAFDPYKDSETWRKIVMILGAVVGSAAGFAQPQVSSSVSEASKAMHFFMVRSPVSNQTNKSSYSAAITFRFSSQTYTTSFFR